MPPCDTPGDVEERRRWAIVHGLHMLLHDAETDIHISRSLAACGVWEPFETDLVRREIQPGDTVLDIGANIGYFTLLFAQLVGEQGRVYAFEPDPTNFHILRRNIERNGLKNVVPEQKAVSSRTGKIRLFSDKTNRGDNRTFDPGDGRDSVEVDAVSLDEYFSNIVLKINFIKIDIQGGELAAVQGMRSLLRGRERLSMISEFWTFGLERSGGSAADYLHLLIELGFRLFWMDDRTKLHGFEGRATASLFQGHRVTFS